jgi:EAL domain-containing protein (putative c-di-GMP-specific phosphodiesterase class I)
MLEALRQIASPGPLGEASIERVLAFARTHLDMELAWITRMAGPGQVIEFLDGAADRFGVSLGAIIPPFSRPCRPVGTYAVAPLLLPDGRLFGHLACLGEQARPTLPRDEQFLQLVAALLAPSISALEDKRGRRARIGARVQAVLDSGGPAMVYQPIWALEDRRLVGYEALARFPRDGRPLTPERWFSDAAEVGLGVELEAAAVRRGVAVLPDLPPGLVVSVNVSAASMQDPGVLDAFDTAYAERTIVEITEHDQVDDYPALRSACEELKDIGYVIAVDDAGAGYAGFQHLVEIRPDLIKVDQQITRNLDTDPARAAMASALVGFAQAIDATVLAEGIETLAELTAATRLGVHLAQGYYLGRPRPLTGERPGSSGSSGSSLPAARADQVVMMPRGQEAARGIS